MDLTRRQILAGSAASLALGLPTRARASTDVPRHFILVYIEGGWDTTVSIDPKSPDDVDGPWNFSSDVGDDVEYTKAYRDMNIQLNDGTRPYITDFFERWAAEENRVSLVRGTWNGALAHETARPRTLTGTTLGSNPDLHAIIGSVLGESTPLGSIDLSSMSYTGYLAASSGQMGARAQMGALIDPYRSFAAPAGEAPYPRFVPGDADEDAIQQILRRRNSQYREARGDGGKNDHLLDARIESMRRGLQFQRESGSLLEIIEPGKQMDFATQMDLATGLLANGLCHAAMVETRLEWDTHVSNIGQGGKQDSTFAHLSYLNELLKTTLDSTGQPMIDSTLVLVTSEMTRTPLLNSSMGKDHWPHCSSILMGSGFKPGRVFGGTNQIAESLDVDFATGAVDSAGERCKYDNFAAGIVQAMGVDPEPFFPKVVPYSPYQAG
ncbi:MAG: DUF1501 domain-containing protein [Rhodobacterales bacterium]|nr:DUF1501 domain-containing protein [Rhodobacterales bacterium]